MKYIITLLVTLLMSVASYADVVREGNVYIVKTTTTVNDKSLDIFYQDKTGNQYLIYQSSKGSLYVIKTSKKTGKEYKYYLPKELQEQIKAEQKNWDKAKGL